MGMFLCTGCNQLVHSTSAHFANSCGPLEHWNSEALETPPLPFTTIAFVPRVTVNLNTYVWVELGEKGLEIIKDRAEFISERNGKYRFQLHDLMATFGEALAFPQRLGEHSVFKSTSIEIELN